MVAITCLTLLRMDKPEGVTFGPQTSNFFMTTSKAWILEGGLRSVLVNFQLFEDILPQVERLRDFGRLKLRGQEARICTRASRQGFSILECFLTGDRGVAG
jgi:hypothetical protein